MPEAIFSRTVFLIINTVKLQSFLLNCSLEEYTSIPVTCISLHLELS